MSTLREREREREGGELYKEPEDANIINISYKISYEWSERERERESERDSGINELTKLDLYRIQSNRSS